VLPAGTVKEVGEIVPGPETVVEIFWLLGAVAVPNNSRELGATLPLISTNALFDPVAFGRNDTAIVQLPEGAIAAPQVFAIENSAASSPRRVMVDT